MPVGGGGVSGQISEQRLQGGLGGLGHGVVGRPGRGMPAPGLCWEGSLPKLICEGFVGEGNIGLDFHC